MFKCAHIGIIYYRLSLEFAYVWSLCAFCFLETFFHLSLFLNLLAFSKCVILGNYKELKMRKLLIAFYTGGCAFLACTVNSNTRINTKPTRRCLRPVCSNSSSSGIRPASITWLLSRDQAHFFLGQIGAHH